MIRIAACLAVVLFALLPTTFARADTGPCTVIRSLPAVITSQGTYCLEHDLSTAISRGEAISIQANNVTIDCRHRKIGGLASGTGSHASGIFAMDRKNITIRNCAIRGFANGIFLFGSGGAYHLVEDNRVELSTRFGIHVEGEGITVRRNRVLDIGVSASDVYGIRLVGSGTISDNAVHGVATSGLMAVGIHATRVHPQAGSALVADNRVSGLGAAHVVKGILARRGAAITDNLVAHAGPSPPATGANGIDCFSEDGEENFARGNTLLGFAAPAIGVAGCPHTGTVSQ